MRIATLAALAAVLALSACASAPALPTPPSPAALIAGCAPQDDCPPVGPVTRPGDLVPVYKTVEEPIYEERRTPVWGHKTVPVYQVRRVPVTVTLPDACTGCEREVHLWDKEQKVQVGTQRVPACLGYRTERVRVGSCPKQVRVGWRPAVEEEACAPSP